MMSYIDFWSQTYSYIPKLFTLNQNNLRELGFGDVSVNKKMKELNKILYDILLKIDKSDDESLIINKELILKYFKDLKQNNDQKYADFERYLVNFYNFCFTNFR